MLDDLIEEISPLHEYWNTEQTDYDEKNRLMKSNDLSKAVYLFKEEPYKWEILYHSSMREILSGESPCRVHAVLLLFGKTTKMHKKKQSRSGFMNLDCLFQWFFNVFSMCSLIFFFNFPGPPRIRTPRLRNDL